MEVIGNVLDRTLVPLSCLSVDSMEKTRVTAADGEGPSLTDFFGNERTSDSQAGLEGDRTCTDAGDMKMSSAMRMWK